MTDHRRTNQSIQLHAITTDLKFVSRFFSSVIRSLQPGNPTAVLSFYALAPLVSLVVFESRRKLRELGPNLSGALDPSVAEFIESSRHSLKLFEDNKRSLQESIEFFRSQVIDEHKKVMLGNTWLPLARYFENDLGVFEYENRPFTNTHFASRFLGIPAQVLLHGNGGAVVSDLALSISSYVVSAGGEFDSEAKSFLDELDETLLRAGSDVKSWRYYDGWYDASVDRSLNGLIEGMHGLLNFVTRMLPLDKSGLSAQTIFKFQYLTAYHLIGSLELLADDDKVNLSPRSKSIIQAAVRNKSFRTIRDDNARKFRNALMHYGNYDKGLSSRQTDLNKPLYGWVEHYYPDHSFTSLQIVVREALITLSSLMEMWQRKD